MEDKQAKKQSKKSIVPGVLITVLCSFMFFLYAPVQMYVRNSDDFSYDLYDLLKMIFPVWLICFMVTVIVIYLISRLLPGLYKFFLAAEATVTVASYIEGNFLSGFIPELTGKGIDWSQYAVHRWYSVILWVVLTGIFLFLAVRLRERQLFSVISYAGGFGSALLVLTMIFSLNGEATRDKADFYATTDHMLELSSEQNFVLMILDTIDGVHFDEYIQENPQYHEILQDFTFYKNALGTYPGTKWAIPFILSGTWFENQTGYYRYREEAYINSPLFSALKDNGYRMGLYQEDPPLAEQLPESFENLAEPESESFMHPGEFRKMQLMLTGLSYLPFDLKAFCELTPDNIYYDSMKKTSGDSYFSWDNKIFLNALENNGITVSGENPSFRMYVLQGTHEPYESTLEASISDCFDLIETYINSLKNAGVYDNTVVVIMGDHGYFPSETYKMNPALFIKGLNEKHEFTISDAPVSYADFPDSFLRLLDGSTENEVFDAREGEERERRFLNPYVIDDEHIVEMLHTGHASDVEAFKETGVIYTPQ